MLRTTSCKLSILATLVSLSVSTTAFAQDKEATVSATASTDNGMTLPAAGVAAGGSDHAQMERRLAIGYMGKRQVSLGATGPDNVSAPVIGVRYWLDSFMGIDAGLGLLIASGSDDNGMVSTDIQSTTAFILHGGLPLSLASEGHFSFQIVPELNLGFASGTIPGAGPAGVDTDLSGFRLELGARAGSEIHFGFIDIPQLSLQAGVGLMIKVDSFGTSVGAIDTSSSRTTIGTTVNDNPWNIFTSNISALYYF